VPRHLHALRVAALVLTGAVAALVALPWLSTTSGEVGPGRVEVSARLQWAGRTSVELPPLGRMTARTPSLPIGLRATVEELDLTKTQAIAVSPNPRGALDADARDDLVGLLRRCMLRTLVGGALLGAAATALLPRRRWWFLPIGSTAAVAGLVATGALAWARFDPGAFEQPRFEGALERAPAIIDAARRHVDDLQGVQDRVRTLGNQLADLYAASSAVDIGGSVAGETRILHVSDVHSNPLGMEFVGRLATSFDVDAVLDTGDLTSFGYPVEARIAELVTSVPVRYLFVPGNHDDPFNRAAIDAYPNVELLDHATTTVGRLRILGIADPTFTATNETTTAEANAAKRKLAPAIAAEVRRRSPDVLAIHDAVEAEDTAGEVPLVLAGHVHRRKQRTEDGTRFLTVGSTGAGGVGTFMVDTGAAYEAEVLHFRGRTLVAIDYVTLQGISGDLTIDRDLVEEPDRDH
jgi:predicted phosphodiesterase